MPLKKQTRKVRKPTDDTQNQSSLPTGYSSAGAQQAAGASQSSQSSRSSSTPEVPHRRNWEAWSTVENQKFFESLVRNSRSWAAIAADVGTKRQEQVRTYYYRVLRKVGRLLAQANYTFDNRDRVATLLSMLSYWEAKCETTYDENSIEFAEAIKERIGRQKLALESMRAKKLPTPDKVVIQLSPQDEQISTILASSGHTPKLQLTLKSRKSIASLVDHLSKKWVTADGSPIPPYPIRVYPQDAQEHRGWGIEDEGTTLLAIYHSLGCPNMVKLIYAWPEIVMPSISEGFAYEQDETSALSDLSLLQQQQQQSQQQQLLPEHLHAQSLMHSQPSDLSIQSMDQSYMYYPNDYMLMGMNYSNSYMASPLAQPPGLNMTPAPASPLLLTSSPTSDPWDELSSASATTCSHYGEQSAEEPVEYTKATSAADHSDFYQYYPHTPNYSLPPTPGYSMPSTPGYYGGYY